MTGNPPIKLTTTTCLVQSKQGTVLIALPNGKNAVSYRVIRRGMSWKQDVLSETERQWGCMYQNTPLRYSPSLSMENLKDTLELQCAPHYVWSNSG
jgi:(2Fe-2S) ferredoxin